MKEIRLKGKQIRSYNKEGLICNLPVSSAGIESEISLSPPDLSKLRVGDEVLVKCRIEMPLDKHYIDLTDLLGQYATFHNESIVAILPKELPNKQASNDGCYTKDEPKCECEEPKILLQYQTPYCCFNCGKPIKPNPYCECKKTKAEEEIDSHSYWCRMCGKPLAPEKPRKVE